MTFTQTVLLYICTVVCALYLVAGGYKTIRAYIRKKIDQAAEAKNAAAQP
ncbi:DUF1378 family protein [Erwinia sp. HR93]|nr:DUF1378 family protein [Erwinia sp. HR93]MEA1064518.1 DUF1378 family protein [Erwinia sp. HR93]MEA1065691.1 DUF1378 family protein [Erwinia sp. HR93]